MIMNQPCCFCHMTVDKSLQNSSKEINNKFKAFLHYLVLRDCYVILHNNPSHSFITGRSGLGAFVSVEWSMLFSKVRNKVSQGQIISRSIDRNAGSFNEIDRKQTLMRITSLGMKDVRANCFCASLLRTQIHTPRHAPERALSNKMNNDRAGGNCYSFAWIYRSSAYFSVDGSFSLPIFYV